MHTQNISQNPDVTIYHDTESSNMLFPDMLGDGVIPQESLNAVLEKKLDIPNKQSSKVPLEKKLDIPNQDILAHHLKQWTEESGVSEKITRLNVSSLADQKEIAKRLGWRKYTHTSGWWCSGINPLSGKKLESGIGQFRPDETWLDPKSGDLAKYLTPKVGYDAICLGTGDPEYWQKVIEDISIPINITEGAKKAGAGLTHGYPTISLSGVWMGVINVGTPHKKKYRLVPTLRMFCQPGRIFYLCFDADIVRKKEIRAALRFLAKLLIEEGCIVKVVQWNEERGKGMDDHLVNYGKESFDAEIAKAQLIEEWEKQFDDEDEKEEEEKKQLPKHSGMSLILKPRINNLRFNDKIHQWEKYQTGYWSIASQESIIQRVSDHIEELYPKVEFDSSYPNGVSQSLISRLLEENLPEPPRHLLPFKNGVLDLETKLILPHSQEYNFNSIIDREHDLNAKDWSLISEWMDFVFYGNVEQIHLMLCWYAAILRRLYELHRFALVYGGGGTGKSTAMKVGSDLVGKNASHSLTLEALNTNSFQTGNIYNKRLICLNDADRYHGNLGIFKNITGGDEINVEWKFEKAFNAVYKGLVMVSANNPVFTLNDDGIGRRIILFKFDRKVNTIDTSFDKKLSSQMSAFTNYLLGIPEDEVVETLLYKVDGSGTRIQNELDALLQTNGVAEWLNNRYVYDPSSQVQIGNDKTQLQQLYGDYCDYASKSGSSPMSSKAFSPEVVRLGRGHLTKKKSMYGVTLQGLRRDDSGGLIEKIISIPTDTVSDPSYPSYPSCNDQNTCQANVSDMTGQGNDPSSIRHSAPSSMTGHDGSEAHPSLTRHAPQTPTQQGVEASEKPDMTGMTDKSRLRGEKEKIINQIPDNLPLTQKITQAWDSQWELGRIILAASSEELKLATTNYTSEQIKHIKDAANFCWQPQINQFADYAGESVEIWEVNQTREVRIRTLSGTIQKIKRGNLRPWLGI